MPGTWPHAGEIDDKPLGRTICNERIVFYRGDDGRRRRWRTGARTAARRCRWAGGRGQAGLRLPRPGDGLRRQDHRHAGPARARLSAGPQLSRWSRTHGFVWVWPATRRQAERGRCPTCTGPNDPEWAYGGGLYHVKADYRLMIDNLMDLTHETYVHATSIGQPEIDETPCTTAWRATSAVTSRFMNGIQAPPFWRMALRSHGLPDDQPVDRWQICRFSPPSHVMIEVGVALAGHGGYEAPKDKKVYSIVVDFITPETETSMWYFWGMARNFRARGQGADGADPRRAGQDLRRGPGDAGTPAGQPVAVARAPTC
jgi:vanillate O-demethylase monooxygenase subunit